MRFPLRSNYKGRYSIQIHLGNNKNIMHNSILQILKQINTRETAQSTWLYLGQTNYIESITQFFHLLHLLINTKLVRYSTLKPAHCKLQPTPFSPCHKQFVSAQYKQIKIRIWSNQRNIYFSCFAAFNFFSTWSSRGINQESQAPLPISLSTISEKKEFDQHTLAKNKKVKKKNGPREVNRVSIIKNNHMYCLELLIASTTELEKYRNSYTWYPTWQRHQFQAKS